MRAPKKPNPPGRRAERREIQSSWRLFNEPDSKYVGPPHGPLICVRKRTDSGVPYLVVAEVMKVRTNI